jgi:hypothetical protein
MIVVIRGHLRESFDTKNLYYFIEELNNIFPDLKIFIHTWNVYSNNLSWRKININNNEVNEEIIYNYFSKFKDCIKCIIIDDDKKIKKNGNLKGKIGNSSTPVDGWKNYWYGQFKIINYIFNENKYNDETIINFRFDLFNNSNNFNKNLIIDFIKNNSNVKFNKNEFLFNEMKPGIDNIYMGNINTMYILVHMFYYKLDYILSNNKNVIFPEVLVHKVNSKLFNSLS